jgi:hypothetical protein
MVAELQLTLRDLGRIERAEVADASSSPHSTVQ